MPHVLPGHNETPALLASLLLATLALAAAGGGIAYSVTGSGAGAVNAAATVTRSGRIRRGSIRMRAILGDSGASTAWVVAWGAMRQVAFAALAAGSTYGIGALIGAHVS